MISKDTLENASSQDEDARLMLAVQANDAFAFEELMARNQSRIYAYFLRLVGNRQMAEDLTQDLFMRVYKNRDSYRPEARFSTWLYRVAHNLAFNSLRAKNRRPETLFGAADVSGAQTSFEESLVTRSGSTPTREIARLELQDAVRAAVRALGPRQREAIQLSRFEGMSYQEIADVMEMTPQAVKSLLCRARINLKDALEPFVKEGKRPV